MIKNILRHSQYIFYSIPVEQESWLLFTVEYLASCTVFAYNRFSSAIEGICNLKLTHFLIWENWSFFIYTIFFHKDMKTRHAPAWNHWLGKYFSNIVQIKITWPLAQNSGSQPLPLKVWFSKSQVASGIQQASYLESFPSPCLWDLCFILLSKGHLLEFLLGCPSFYKVSINKLII